MGCIDRYETAVAMRAISWNRDQDTRDQADAEWRESKQILISEIELIRGR